ncbi:MAG: TetR/AcrR family transcriptional regulator [Nitriliruptor sp.]|nr:MAG: TetR/AcrR family transcriptional regulator [Nitriliruptor sp.]
MGRAPQALRSSQSGPGRPRERHVDDDILTATRELLAEVGFERLTMTDVAARAGVGRPTVYRRYPSKEALVAASVEALRRDEPAPDTGTLCGDLRAELLPRAPAFGHPLVLQFLAMLLVSNAERSEFAEVYWRDAVAQRRDAFGEILVRAQARGELAVDADVDLLTDVVAGTVIYQILRPVGARTESLEGRLERLIALLCSMLGRLERD